MQLVLKKGRLTAMAIAAAVMLAAALPAKVALAQMPPSTGSSSVALSEPTIKALQEALNKQGIAVKVDGVLSDETRAAIKKYQTQHHLPITGDADKATLDKLGVAARQSAVSDGQAAQVQATATTGAATQLIGPQQGPMQPGQMQPGQTPQGGTVNCAMMQGQMQGMMQMMQGMMQMMQGQMQPGQMQPGEMPPGQMSPGQKPPR